MTKDRDRYGALGGAMMSGVPGVHAAVAAEVAKDELAVKIRALGGSEIDVEEALALVRAKLEASPRSWRHYSIEDACEDVLWPWMTGDKRSTRSVEPSSEAST